MSLFSNLLSSGTSRATAFANAAKARGSTAASNLGGLGTTASSLPGGLGTTASSIAGGLNSRASSIAGDLSAKGNDVTNTVTGWFNKGKKIAEGAGSKLETAMKDIAKTPQDNSLPMNAIHNFLLQKSVLRSTHFMVTTNFCNPWQIEDFGIALPTAEVESMGYLANQYTMPMIKNSEPIKLTLTIADNELGEVYQRLLLAKSEIIVDGLYMPPSYMKVYGFNVKVYTPSGETILTFNLQNAYMLSFDDVKYSYSSMTDYQKYAVTFVCDQVDFSID